MPSASNPSGPTYGGSTQQSYAQISSAQSHGDPQPDATPDRGMFYPPKAYSAVSVSAASEINNQNQRSDGFSINSQTNIGVIGQPKDKKPNDTFRSSG